MKRIVISGAGGFLGRNIIREAVVDHIPVIAISSRPEKLQGDGVCAVSTDNFLNGKVPLLEQDVFINCMFPTNADGVKMADGLDAVYTTMKAAKERGIGAFINISSQSVYASKREAPADEATRLSLETPYAVGKYSTEILCNEIFKEIPHTNIRLASLLGIGYEQRIVNRMIVRALKGDSLQIIGGMQRYGFLDVRDAAAGLISISQSDGSMWKTAYNLGRMDSCTLLEVASLIVKKLQERGYAAEYCVSEGTDTRNSAINAGLFIHDFNWEPRITLEQTVTDIIDSKI